MKAQLEVEIWPIERVTRYERNPRRNSEAVAKTAASIAEFGFRQPLVVDEEGVLIAGDTRLLAARTLGYEDVPVHVARGLTTEQIAAYRIADNRTHEEADWDNELLALELGDLAAAGYDLGMTAFDDAELATLMAPEQLGLTPEDNLPEKAKAPTPMPGEIWQLGHHRLACGDARDPELTKALFAGVEPTLMVTDPPYGVDYHPKWRKDTGVNAPHHETKMGEVRNDAVVDWSDALGHFPGDVAYVWHAGKYAGDVQRQLESLKFQIRSQIIWQKPSLVISRGNYHWQHEPCWYAIRKGTTAHWQGSRKESTIWPANVRAEQDAQTDHSTQKPVEIMRRPMANNTSPGQAVYDPFVGSGTSIIAAESIQRVCYAVELDPAYVHMAIERWQNFTGETAKLGEQTFAEVTEARNGTTRQEAEADQPACAAG